MRDRKVHAYRACILLHGAEFLYGCMIAALIANRDFASAELLLPAHCDCL